MAGIADLRSFELGKSRPPLAITDLPEPEEVFRVRRIGPRELLMYAIGPSLIALGISIGSGEWLLGPQAVGQFGFVGVGWVILISALLQTLRCWAWVSSKKSPSRCRARCPCPRLVLGGETRRRRARPLVASPWMTSPVNHASG